MNIEVGNFCFIDEAYYDRFNDDNLMMNKLQSGGGYRPHYIAFQDSKNSEIYWAVPISSSLENYTNKREKRIAHNSQHRCDEIIIARARYGDAAYLIQNMCPVDARYINGIWSQGGVPIGISRYNDYVITQAARRVLEAERRGGHQIRPRSLSIYKSLNLDIRIKQALPMLKQNRSLISCRFEKSTERGMRLSYLATNPNTPTDISLVEEDRLFDGSVHTKKTSISSGRFVSTLEEILATNWDRVIEKASDFEASLDAAETKAKAEQCKNNPPQADRHRDGLR